MAEFEENQLLNKYIATRMTGPVHAKKYDCPKSFLVYSVFFQPLSLSFNPRKTPDYLGYKIVDLFFIVAIEDDQTYVVLEQEASSILNMDLTERLGLSKNDRGLTLYSILVSIEQRFGS